MGLAVRNIFSGFTVTLAQAVMSLLVVRACVINLDKATYGVCAAVTQVMALMAFLDLGLGPALARYVVDYRRTMTDTEFGGMFKAMLRISAVQFGACLAVMGMGAGVMAGVLRISATSNPLFREMIWLVALPTSLSFIARPFGQLLYASGRLYAVNLMSMGAAMAQGAVALFGLYHGWGAYSIVAGHWVYILAFQGATVFESWRTRLVPPLRVPAAPLGSMRPLFAFSRDVFIATFGRQLLQFAPTLLVSRLFGEARLGDWHAGTRMLYFVMQIVGRVSSSVEPLLWKIYAHGDREILKVKLGETVRAAVAVAAFLGSGLVMCNTLFVTLWTGGRVLWSPGIDALCALWILSVALELGGGTLLGTTKRIGRAPWVYFAEMAAIFGLSSLPALRPMGFGAAAVALAATHVAFTLSYHTWRIRSDLDVAWRSIAGLYGLAVVVFAGLTGLTVAVALQLKASGPGLAAAVVFAVQALVVTPAVWFGIVPRGRRQELSRVAGRMAQQLGWMRPA